MMVFKDIGTRQHQGLTRIVGRHFGTSRFETSLQLREDFIIQHERPLKNAGNDLARHVILGGAKPSDRYHQGSARK